MPDQPGLFDNLGDPIPEEIRVTLGDGPHVRPARSGFIAGMLATWVFDGKPTARQKEQLIEIARNTLAEAERISP